MKTDKQKIKDIKNAIEDEITSTNVFISKLNEICSSPKKIKLTNEAREGLIQTTNNLNIELEALHNIKNKIEDITESLH
ncbi:hypothetical protein AAGG74_14960 [Bacillus mexicanus]|uniref:hypothetical protein n=1 Tax=Bacillus mexicanus TaxID=2834415 RepID=UPI003D21968C